MGKHRRVVRGVACSMMVRSPPASIVPNRAAYKIEIGLHENEHTKGQSVTDLLTHFGLNVTTMNIVTFFFVRNAKR
jgi:hypothetical protein